eukprot:CAMPEP_0181330464 /NCGR_PEP_ID=MMETSP1101-20121128/23915_1 /TAXON_ID=46948 /ORGANISM="Rhodomonas abbreviata, Strain Caron Lab Isolate" /LENGTH=63 /DNA_ID=CAMNT_0023439725 /DNA_START=68 /DNA_END=255 /DNA_ORIENTATION=-
MSTDCSGAGTASSDNGTEDNEEGGCIATNTQQQQYDHATVARGGRKRPRAYSDSVASRSPTYG